MKLTYTEIHTPLWQKLEAHYKNELTSLRLRNDGFSVSELETAQLRGQIKQIKMFLELADPKTLITDSRDADDYEFIMTEKP
jgi:hypothetical protein